MPVIWPSTALSLALGFSRLGPTSAGAPAARPSLETLLDSSDVRSGDMAKRATAWLAVRDRATPEDLAVLEEAALKHRSTHARRLAAEVIGTLALEPGVTTLCAVLERDPSDQVRRAAAYALGLLGSKEGAAGLRQAMLSDTVANNRKRAAASLSRLLGDDAEADLRTALDGEKDATVRTAIEWLLARPPAQTVLPKVEAGTVSNGVCKGTRYLVYAPKQYTRDRDWPVLVSVHATDGRPEGYLDIVRPDADKHGVVLIVPWFDFSTFDHWGTWSLRHLGMPRADLRLLDIVEDAGKTLRARGESVMLYGHSQGGQFVHRFVLAHRERVSRAVAAAPGAIVLPDPQRGFPEGTGPNPRLPDLGALDYGDLAEAEMAVVVGAKDTEERLALAEKLISAAKQYAEEHGLRCRVEHMVVPDHGHGGRGNYRQAGSRFLFGDPAP